jgi:hypothetical protein
MFWSAKVIFGQCPISGTVQKVTFGCAPGLGAKTTQESTFWFWTKIVGTNLVQKLLLGWSPGFLVQRQCNKPILNQYQDFWCRNSAENYFWVNARISAAETVQKIQLWKQCQDFWYRISAEPISGIVPMFFLFKKQYRTHSLDKYWDLSAKAVQNATFENVLSTKIFGKRKQYSTATGLYRMSKFLLLLTPCTWNIHQNTHELYFTVNRIMAIKYVLFCYCCTRGSYY